MPAGPVAIEKTTRELSVVTILLLASSTFTVIAAIELPKEAKGSEYAKTRLTQLRRYAGYLEQNAGKPAAEQEVEHEFAGMGPGSGPAMTTTAPDAGAPDAGAAVAGVAAVAAETKPATIGAAPTPPAANPATTPDALAAPARSQTRSWYSLDAVGEAAKVPIAEPIMETAKEPEIVFLKTPPEAVIERIPPRQRDWTASPVGEDTAEVVSPTLDEPRVDLDWGVGEGHSEQNAVSFSWNGAPVQPETTAAPTLEPLPPIVDLPIIPTAPAAPAAPQPAAVTAKAGEQTSNWGAGDTATRSAQAAVAAAAAAFWGTPNAPRMEQAAASWGKQVSTATDVMALPPNDRPDMLAFLPPAELSKVFKSTDDSNLKKAVIDTLEHVGNTASLDAIHESLDDPDPEVQLYALDAADRILGKGI